MDLTVIAWWITAKADGASINNGFTAWCMQRLISGQIWHQYENVDKL